MRARATRCLASAAALAAAAFGYTSYKLATATAWPEAASSMPAPTDSCRDQVDACSGWADAGECESNPTYMDLSCPLSCGLCGGAIRRPRSAPRRLYETARRLVAGCRDESDECGGWAASGECASNPRYMEARCPRACNAGCAADRPACRRSNATAAVADGDVGRMFRRLLAEYPQYRPRALSSDPYVVVLDDFVTPDEAARIRELCAPHFSRSLAGDKVAEARTSHQCWGMRPNFLSNAAVRAVTARIGALTMTDERNAEYFQVVRYEVGQFYQTHHDQNSAPFTPQGARLYTFFVYLNTPEEGGGTRFNDLGLTVEPRLGRAVLWPSVMDSSVGLPELRTHHEALRVAKGEKYGANLWIHMHDFKTPAEKGCELTHKNTFDPESQLERYAAARRAAGLDDETPASMQHMVFGKLLESLAARAHRRVT